MQIGDRRTELLHFGDGSPRMLSGRIVYIHPEHRFYIVEFELNGCRLREAYAPQYRPKNEG